MVESGRFYSTLVDPLLIKMRKKVADQMEPGQKIIDIACGTGAQVFELAKNAKQVTGIDLSPSMIKKANKNKNKLGIKNVSFQISDATNLTNFYDNEFDIASMSLALHQFSPSLYTPILKEMTRISKKIIIVDYSVPLPKNILGYGSKWAEFMAGGDHFRNFKKFYTNGGLENILNGNKIFIEKSIYFARDTFQLVVASENRKIQ